MRVKCRLMVWLGFFVGSACLVACGSASYDSGGWNNSPTGTFWEPIPGDGLQPGGYVALDEACELTDDADYLRRFETPMFRSVAERHGVAWMVDGSLLWGVDVTNTAAPERRSLMRLDGHPLQVDITAGGHLLVAAGEAGLHVVDVEDASNPSLLHTVELDDVALDVTVAGDLALVAMGDSGVRVLQVDSAGSATLLAAVDVPGFTVALDVQDDRAYVASCTTVSVLDLADAQTPLLLSSFWVPHGHAKDIKAESNQIYVAGGEALFGYDASDATTVLWTGYYDEPETPGFYVNALVVSQGVIYIAAGDESVRSISADKLSDAVGYPALKVESENPPPSLGGPETLPDPSVVEEPVEVDWNPSDPIGIGLRDDLLFVLGNFRWMGERTLFLFHVTPAGMMAEQASYVQPNRWVGLTSTATHLVLLGSDGANRAVPFSGGPVTNFSVDRSVSRTVSLNAGLYLLTDSGTVHRWVDGATSAVPIVAPGYSGAGFEDMAGAGDRLYLSDRHRNAIAIHYLPDGQYAGEVAADMGFLGWSRLAATESRFYAYDWELGRLHTFLETAINYVESDSQHVGHCEMYDIRDYFAGDRESHSRLKITADNQLLLLCPRDPSGQASVHRYHLADPFAPEWVATEALPQGRFVAFDIIGEAIVTLRFDNDRYQSTITRSEGGVHRSSTFTGVGNGMVLRNGVAYVIDGEGLLRAFDVSGDSAPHETTPPDIH